MTPAEREEMKRRARAKLAAMRERARLQRRRVVTGAAIVFAVLWLAIFTQMITGHDPALGPPTAAVRPATRGDEAPESEARTLSPEEGEEGEDEGEGDEEEDGSLVEEVAPPIAEVVRPVEEAIEGPREEPEELEPATTGQS